MVNMILGGLSGHFQFFLTYNLKQSQWLQTQINILHNRRWSASLRFENVIVIDELADVTASAS